MRAGAGVNTEEYTVFDISLEVRSSVAASLDAYAKATGVEPAGVLIRVFETVMSRNLFAEILGRPDAPKGDRRYRQNKVAPAAAPICETCGGPRSIYSAHQCRGCYAAGLRKPAAAPTPPPICVDCGGPRSPGSAKRCRDCYRAHIEARRRTWNIKEVGPVIGVKPPPAPVRPSPVPPPPAPRLAGPSTVRPVREREEQHPILARHARQAPVDPLAKPRERKPPPPPAFSEEFLAKLKRVAEGAPIVEVKPISQRGEDERGGGSSLDFV